MEHQVLKYLRNKIAHYLHEQHDYRRHWFSRFGLPPPNGEHDQLRKTQIGRLMRRVQWRMSHQGGGRPIERPEIHVFSRLDIGHKDFFGEQLVNCRPFRNQSEPPRASADGLLSSSFPRPRSLRGPAPNNNGKFVTMDCDCAMIDCLYDYAPGCRSE